MRAIVTGAYTRNNSSMAVGHKSGLSRNCLRCSGCWAMCHMHDPIADHVVSTPATSIKLHTPSTYSIGTTLPSTSVFINSVMKSSSRGFCLRSATCAKKNSMMFLRAHLRPSASMMFSRAARTHAVKSDSISSGTPSKVAITRTGICCA